MGGSAGAGGAGATGGGGTGAVGQWKATTEWTSLPIPLDFGPTLAPHPTNASQFTVLASSFSVSGTTLVAATTPDLGTSFPTTATLTPLPQTAMGEPKGIAYNPKNPQEIAAALWVQGPEGDPTSGGHLYRSTDGGGSFQAALLTDTLPVNTLAFTRLRYTHDGFIALRAGASIVTSQDGTSVDGSVDTADCSDGAFDVNPEDATEFAVACGPSVALCTPAGCSKTSVPYNVLDVRYGTDGQHMALVGGAGDKYAALVSVDGGKTFNANQEFSDNVSPSWRVDWDPRPSVHTAYALLVDHLFRSADGGATWQDVTPPPELNYIYDFVVAADGTVVGRGVFHYLLLSP